MDDTIDIPAIEALIDAEYAKAGAPGGYRYRRHHYYRRKLAQGKRAPRRYGPVSSCRRLCSSLAGPDLESVLAGYGAGAGDYSKHTAVKPVINFDIGG